MNPSPLATKPLYRKRPRPDTVGRHPLSNTVALSSNKTFETREGAVKDLRWVLQDELTQEAQLLKDLHYKITDQLSRLQVEEAVLTMMYKGPELSDQIEQHPGEDISTISLETSLGDHLIEAETVTNNALSSIYIENHRNSKDLFEHSNSGETMEYVDVMNEANTGSPSKEHTHLELDTETLLEQMHESQQSMMDDIFDAKQTEDILRKVRLGLEFGNDEQELADIEEAIQSLPGTPGIHYEESDIPMVDNLLTVDDNQEPEPEPEESEEEYESEDYAEEEDEDDEAARQALSQMLAKYGDLA